MNKYQEALLKVINTFNDIQLGFEYSAKEFTIYTTILKELVDKAIPKKPYYLNYGGYKIGNYHCPNCEGIIDDGDMYCKHCGQKLDWSNEFENN